MMSMLRHRVRGRSAGGLPGKMSLASLPTPVRAYRLHLPAGNRRVYVKLDNLTGSLYGGNKVRKLEYYFHRARERYSELVATFGTVGSQHALATALYAAALGYSCTCFLSHQKASPAVAATLRTHLRLGTRIVRYGGDYPERIGTLRANLWGRAAWVVPAGGTCWLGTYAFVRAGQELAEQVAQKLLPEPERLYVATGTMGTAAGLALGLALAGLRTEVHAVRVSHTWLCNEVELARILRNTTNMMRRFDAAVPNNLHRRARITLRHEFFAGGYARSNAETEAAIALAREQLGLELESTYTGKAMAAILSDVDSGEAGAADVLFWNTYNSAKLPEAGTDLDRSALPAEFLRYVA
jgi:D-cysteine desulfhydrase